MNRPQPSNKEHRPRRPAQGMTVAARRWRHRAVVPWTAQGLGPGQHDQVRASRAPRAVRPCGVGATGGTFDDNESEVRRTR